MTGSTFSRHRPSPTIPHTSLWSVGTEWQNCNFGIGGSAVWPSANLAIFVPLYLPVAVTVTKGWWLNGAAVSGNYDFGIYDEAGARMVSSGTTVQAGISQIQVADLTDTFLSPGTYYMALASDNTTGTTIRGIAVQQGAYRAIGIANQAAAFVLPATATLAAVANNYVPYMGISLRTVTGTP